MKVCNFFSKICKICIDNPNAFFKTVILLQVFLVIDRIFVTKILNYGLLMRFDTTKTLGILGGGQLGKMLVQAAMEFDIYIKSMDPDSSAPCATYAHEFVCASLLDYEKVIQFGLSCDIITIEIEHVNVDALDYLASIGKKVYPQPSVLRTIQNKRIQKEFFVDGDETNLRPMILKDIAEKIEMDISTVSRVANSKSIQTEFGVYPLKYFFSEGIATDSGEDVSNREVKSVLQGMVDAEDKKRPLSDDKLVKMLNKKGYNIARRTVAKYREQLQIPVARLRKEL